MSTFLITVFASFVGFGLFVSATLFGTFLGKQRPRRCACVASREIMKQYQAREKAKKAASLYSPRTVDPAKLPIFPEEFR